MRRNLPLTLPIALALVVAHPCRGQVRTDRDPVLRPGGGTIVFRDVTAAAGLADPLAGLMGHGAAWGDPDGDGRLDLYVGGFADRPDAEYAPAEGPVPNRLLRSGGEGRFVRARTLLASVPDGPARALALARSSGRVYYTAGPGEGPLMRYDPTAGGPPVPIGGAMGIRAATEETPQRLIYTVSPGSQEAEARLAALDTRTERVEPLGPAAVGTQQYIASLDADPTGRYLYYIPGAHGGSDADGSAVVQFDVRSRRRKVIAFLHPFYRDRYGLIPRGTYSAAVSPDGATLYVTWNVSRGGRAWDCCALTVLHIPASERRP
jgi:hypothetical protein